MKWPSVKLSQIAEINPRGWVSRDLPEDLEVTFAPMAAVSEVTASIESPEKRLLSKVSRGYTPFRPSDVLFAKITPCMENGKVALAERLENGLGFGSTEFHILRAKPGTLPSFLFHIVRQPSFRAAAKQSMRGGVGQQRVPQDFLESYSLRLPPTSEQRRIVEILEQADAIRKKRAEADRKAERILPALFYKMFGDPDTKPLGWARIQLGKLLKGERGALQSGPFGSNLHNSDFVDEGSVLAVGIDNVDDSGFDLGRNRRITHEKYEDLKKYKLESGDVLITIMGTVGRTCVFPEWVGKAICTKHVYRIQTERDKLDPEFLSASLRLSSKVKAQLSSAITGQIVDAVTSRNLKDLLIEVPPLALQGRFAHMKRTFDQEATKRKHSSIKLNKLFEVILYRAFCGDLTAKWREAHMKELLVEMQTQHAALERGSNELQSIPQ